MVTCTHSGNEHETKHLDHLQPIQDWNSHIFLTLISKMPWKTTTLGHLWLSNDITILRFYRKNFYDKI